MPGAPWGWAAYRRLRHGWEQMLGPEVKCSWLMIDVAALQPKVMWSGEAIGPVPTSMALTAW